MLEQVIHGQPVIPAARLILRPVQKSDIGHLDLYAGDRRVAGFTRSIPHPLPPGSSEAFVARALSPERTEDIWVMDGTSDGPGPERSELMGVISLHRMEAAGRCQSEVSYWVAPAFWNAGLASEAVQALVAANPQNCDTIFAEVFQDNPISARVVTNAGFEYLGDAEAYSLARGGIVPTWTYLKTLK